MQKNYSKCPLKKRPVHFTFDDSDIKDEPENLCIKKELSDNNNKIISQIVIKKELNDTVQKKLNIISDVDEYDEKILSSSSSTSSVIIPTPTYPKLNIQPWNFHLPYSTDFYRTITNNHQQSNHNNYHHYTNHHHQQISPLRGDLHSPSSPSEGSMSPPPHYLHGRGNSVSPPIYELYPHNNNNNNNNQHHQHHHQHHSSSINGKQQQNNHIIKPEVIPSHRFMPYQVPYQPYAININNHHNHHQHQPPISPTYSEASSYYSIRSQTPESNCSAPEDLSIKQISSPSSTTSSSSLSSSSSLTSLSNYSKHDNNRDSTISTKTNLDIKEKVSPPRYQCPDCNKSYSTFSGLTKHQQFHCPAAEGNQIKKSFSCKDCDKTYVSLGALKMHIRTHTLPCKCTICGKAFSRPWLLQGHIRTHTGEKPFSCQHCHRAFADRSNLRAHLQTHSDIKKYSCTTCSKTFSRMSLLTKHNEGGCPGVNGSGSPPYMTSFQEH